MTERIKGIIDRFEGNFVVVEFNGGLNDFPRDIFPKEATSGDVVEITSKNVKVLKGETEILRKEIEDLMNDVWED
ncbi:hypothetical protein JOC77_001054 [Peribacillus deserti]|uniref:DUF3006 domain-containing protein n=1 Tax=Peribacillus deserti TaxID=673318 RepID=A0ABS2QEX6_9BACI|nr:DUF3006 domain-containing protein [Peribacillus deserti]MBM7691647.1 hypothetical protein [Peribacillus deserti]